MWVKISSSVSVRRLRNKGALKAYFAAAILYHILLSRFYSIMWAISSFRSQVLTKLWSLKLSSWWPSIGIGNQRAIPVGRHNRPTYYDILVDRMMIKTLRDLEGLEPRSKWPSNATVAIGVACWYEGPGFEYHRGLNFDHHLICWVINIIGMMRCDVPQGLPADS